MGDYNTGGETVLRTMSRAVAGMTDTGEILVVGGTEGSL